MEKFVSEMVEAFPTVIKNTRFNVVLSGWPATVATVAICGTIVTIFYINADK